MRIEMETSNFFFFFKCVFIFLFLISLRMNLPQLLLWSAYGLRKVCSMLNDCVNVFHWLGIMR
jgi:hypothetical protein